MSAREPTILALGGGGFTMEPGDPALDDLVLELTGRQEPRLLFLPTASGDAGEQVHRFLSAYTGRSCVPGVLSLFRMRELRVPVRELVLSQDAIYVGGGSMRNLTALLREHDLDVLLREAWERGIVLAGLSAGAMCWFDHGVTCSTGDPEVAPGLGFLPGSFSVHHDGEPERRPALLEAVGRGEIEAGYAADDGAGLVFRGTRVERAISSRPGANAYRVEIVEGEPVERLLQPDVLTDGPVGERAVTDDVRELRAIRELRRGLSGTLGG